MSFNQGVFTTIVFVSMLGVYMFTCWYEWCHKPKAESTVSICAKCKYVVKTRWWNAQIKQTRCRTPEDPTPTNFITGKKAYPKFSCADRNLHGTCAYFEKKWWKR